MKVLHVPFSYFPSHCGGTEVYVRALIRELELLGWANRVVAPGEVAEQYHEGDVEVHRIAAPGWMDQSILYGAGEPLSAASFAGLLDGQRPDLVHFHAYSPMVSILWLEAARRRGIPCVYTYHTPTLACGRGTLMRWGSTPCDGEMQPLRCAACTLHGLGVSKPMAWALALVSPVTQRLSLRVPFRITSLIQKRSEAVQTWLDGMSRVVALCAWGREVLFRNGVSRDRLRLVRHGLAVKGMSQRPENVPSEKVRVVFFGRLDRTKGLDVLVDALDLAPDLDVELHCHLIVGSDVETTMSGLIQKMNNDPRIHRHPPVAPDDVVRTMSEYDAVAVPSIWLETGPLVVLEAFAAGVPVLGSDLGGIAEWVTDGHDGLLIRAGDAQDWARGLSRLANEKSLRQSLRSNVKPPPTMRDVGLAMNEIYREVLKA